MGRSAVPEKALKALVWEGLRKQYCFQKKVQAHSWLMPLWHHCPKKRDTTDHSAFLFLANTDILRVFFSSGLKINDFDILCQRKRLLVFHVRNILFLHNAGSYHDSWSSQTPQETLQYPSCSHAAPQSQKEIHSSLCPRVGTPQACHPIPYWEQRS